MTVHRGDVVLLHAPFVSRPGGKLRPMLVVQNDRNNARMSNTVLAVITTNLGRASESTQVLVDPESPDEKASGLLSVSVVSCENLITVQQSHIVRRIGTLSAEKLKLVDAALKASLGLE
jgi:mRNA interferase MazF